MITKLTNWLKAQNTRFKHGGDKHLSAYALLNCKQCQIEYNQRLMDAVRIERLEQEKANEQKWILHASACRETENIADKIFLIEREAKLLKNRGYFDE